MQEYINKTKLYLATDHAGFIVKEKVKKYIGEKYADKYEIIDMGAFIYEALDDYTDFISLAAEKVSENPDIDKAIIFGGSGEGEAILANKYKGVRATTCYGGEYAEDIARLGREHNNTNILSIGGFFVKENNLYKIIDIWIDTKYTEEERHERRINKIKDIENINFK